MVKGAPDYAGIREDGASTGYLPRGHEGDGGRTKVAEDQKITLFDGDFDGKDPEKYAKSFPDQ